MRKDGTCKLNMKHPKWNIPARTVSAENSQ